MLLRDCVVVYRGPSWWRTSHEPRAEGERKINVRKSPIAFLVYYNSFAVMSASKNSFSLSLVVSRAFHSQLKASGLPVSNSNINIDLALAEIR